MFNKIRTILSFVLFLLFTTGLSQPSQVGIIDFYGSDFDQALLRKCFSFKEGDNIPFSLDSSGVRQEKNKITACLTSVPGVKQSDISFICCDENGRLIVFAGVFNKTVTSFKFEKKNDIKLPAKLIRDYDSLMYYVADAVKKGDVSEDYSHGHSLMTYKPARRIQESFISYVDFHMALVRNVLKNSKYEHHREVASDIIAYYHTKTEIVNDLLEASKDPSESVRNNAIRAIGILANYTLAHPELNIVISGESFVEMLNSVSWTDRNKSSLVLLYLTKNRDPQLMDQLTKKSLDALADMAAWKSSSHAIAGFTILGRIAGWTEEAISTAWNQDRPQAIRLMLDKIKAFEKKKN